MKALFVVAAVISAQPLVDGNVLEPSVLNEVEHALAMAPKDAAATTNGVSAFLDGVTNVADRTQLAVRLVSRQRADGRWFSGTNDVTAAAVRLLEGLAK